jgi:hypothetical protein
MKLQTSEKDVIQYSFFNEPYVKYTVCVVKITHENESVWIEKQLALA